MPDTTPSLRSTNISDLPHISNNTSNNISNNTSITNQTNNNTADTSILGEYFSNNLPRIRFIDIGPSATNEEILLNSMSVDVNSLMRHCIHFGVKSKQCVVRHGLPKKYTVMCEEYNEYVIHKMDSRSGYDAITDIKIEILDFDNIIDELIEDEPCELVVKINDYVIFSKRLESNIDWRVLDYPNLIVLYKAFSPVIKICLRTKSSNDLFSDVLFNIKFDSLIEHNASIKMDAIQQYVFSTTDDIQILSMYGQYCVWRYTDLYNSIDDDFKMFYGGV